MIKSATAVKAKIKNKAGGNSDKSQIMLRIYLMERLLERVSLFAKAMETTVDSNRILFAGGSNMRLNEPV